MTRYAVNCNLHSGIVWTKLAAHVVKDEDRANQFLAQIPLKMAEPPWNFNGTIDHGLTASHIL